MSSLPRQHGVVIIVVATTDNGIAHVEARLRQLGVIPTEVLTPSSVRRLVLAPVHDESEGASLVSRLRAEGEVAVVRPEGGPRLAAWWRHTRPVSIGDRLSVCFAWSEHDRRALSNVVELDPDGGFGSGQHPSTWLLMDRLAARIVGGERVLDIGCGSGVLTLCALRLGASTAVAVDIEPHAIEATHRNAGLNGFGQRVETKLAPLKDIEGVFDVVLANIGRATLIEVARDLIRLVSPSGWLAVSGIAPSQCSLLAASLRPLEVLERRTCDEWSALVLAHRPSRAEREVG
jgi:ribosomal protein L11 methyltransferase